MAEVTNDYFSDVSYDSETDILSVTYISGTTVTYGNIDQETYDYIMANQSAIVQILWVLKGKKG